MARVLRRRRETFLSDFFLCFYGFSEFAPVLMKRGDVPAVVGLGDSLYSLYSVCHDLVVGRGMITSMTSRLISAEAIRSAGSKSPLWSHDLPVF